MQPEHVPTDEADSTPKPIAGSEAITETFDQSQRGVLDILLVLDNSGSMGLIIAKVMENLPDLLTHIDASNWQIAVTGTKVLDCVSSRITKQTPDYEEKYRALVNQGVSSNGEWYFLKAIDSLRSNILTRGSVGNLWQCANVNPWLRENSSIAVIIVADQHNECFGYHDADDVVSLSVLDTDPLYKKCKSSDLANALQEMRPKGNAKVYGLLPSPATWEAHKDKDPGVSSIFAASGLVADASYAPIFQNISENVQDILEDVFVLSHVSVGEVKVEVDGNEVSSTLYTIRADSKQLVFDKQYVPTAGQKIKVSYRYMP